MKKNLFFIAVFLLINQNILANSNDWSEDIKYSTQGSCETNNLSFNAARFTKMPLNKIRDGLNIFLQMIIFLREDGTFRVRLIEQGLVGCQNTKDGEVCSYRPYSDTKKFYEGNYTQTNELISLPQIGTIKKIRDDYPWLGYEINLDSNFEYDQLSTQKFLGGKIQINFNDQDINVARICN